MRRLSLPREHGAWLTLTGAVVAGLWLASDRWTAGGLALSLAGAFVVRAQLENRRRAAWDTAARSLCAVAVLAGALVAGRQHQWIGVVTAGVALGAVTGSGLARRLRLHRSAWFEVVSMGALGASAAGIAFLGRASFSASLAIGLVLGTHAAVSVPLVRSDLRPRERRLEPRAMLLGITALSAAALLLWLLGIPAAAIGLVPRAIDLTIRQLTHFRLARAAAVGIRETLELAGVVALVLVGI